MSYVGSSPSILYTKTLPITTRAGGTTTVSIPGFFLSVITRAGGTALVAVSTQ